LYLTSNKAKKIVFTTVGALIALAAFRGAFQAVIISISENLTVFSKLSLQDELEQLRQEKLLYQLKFNQLRNLKEENQELREALNFKKQGDISLVGAEIIAFSPSSWHRYVFVNVGEKEKINEGMLVVDKNGHLIGKVTEVYPKRSKIVLLNNPDFQTPASINNKVSGLLQGSLSKIEILYIEEGDKINVGDLVYAATNPFDSSIKAGKVSRIRKSEDSLFYEISVETFSKEALPPIVFIVK